MVYLSRKHGINPAIPKCFVCGQDKNEIILAGCIGGFKDLKAPQGAVWNEDPCDKCKEQINKGFVALIIVKDGEREGMKTVNIREGDNPYRTGEIKFVSRNALAVLHDKHPSEMQPIGFIEQSEMAVLEKHLDNYIKQCNLRIELIRFDAKISDIRIEEAEKNYKENNYVKHLFDGTGYSLSWNPDWKIKYNPETETCTCTDNLDENPLEDLRQLNAVDELAKKVYDYSTEGMEKNAE